MNKRILGIITAVLLILSLQGCYVGIDPGWGGHHGGGHGWYGHEYDGGGGHHGQDGGHHR